MMLSSDRQLHKQAHELLWTSAFKLTASTLRAGHFDDPAHDSELDQFFSTVDSAIKKYLISLISWFSVVLIMIPSPHPHEPRVSWCRLLSGPLLEFITGVLYLDGSPGSPLLDLWLSSPLLQQAHSSPDHHLHHPPYAPQRLHAAFFGHCPKRVPKVQFRHPSSPWKKKLPVSCRTIWRTA